MTNIKKYLLPHAEKPMRYSGGELNAVCKDLANVKVHGAICFPDLYEIGMSHHGLQILYHIVNANDKWVLSRAFHPWTDAEEIMREHNIPLFTLEYFSPVRDADWIGFSVQYELQYTNLVNMIDIAGVPVLSSDRSDEHPIIIAGGPCMNNPEPLTQFVDAFLIGDGEEAVVRFCEVIEKHKLTNSKRDVILDNIAKIDGFYVPSHYTYNMDGRFCVPTANNGAKKNVRAAKVKVIEALSAPTKPIVPLMEVVHHRLSAEVMRGCTRGCRFCSAGMYYRPVREKNTCDIKSQIGSGTRSTGFRDVGLLSLSTADYSNIGELLSSMCDLKKSAHLKMSFPSTRIDALTSDQLDALNKVAPITSFTIAPEAGSLRLRKVINKDFSDEAIYDTVKLLLDRNAQTIKLYFMIGLPTENDDDIQAIIDMSRTIAAMMRARSPRLSLNISLSPFSPKANTPFQWESMENIEVLSEKGRFIKNALCGDRKNKNIKVSWRDGKMTFLETVMARGDRRVGDVILEAWKMGARFDGWDDKFLLDRWIDAAKSVGVDLEDYIKPIDISQALPWSAVSVGVSVDFLKRERERAFKEEVTNDCRNGECVDCGVCVDGLKPVFANVDNILSDNNLSNNATTQSISTTISTSNDTRVNKDENLYGRKKVVANNKSNVNVNRYRFIFEKKENLRFLGHMDMVSVFHRAMIAAGFPLAFSQGFNPHPRVSFGPPLPFGSTGLCEMFDIETTAPLSGDPLVVNEWLPAGLRVKSSSQNLSKTSLSAAISSARYKIFPPKNFTVDMIKESLENLMAKSEIIIKREKDRKITEKNIRPAIISACVVDDGTPYIETVLSLTQGGVVSCKPSEFVFALFPNENFYNFSLCRVECIF